VNPKAESSVFHRDLSARPARAQPAAAVPLVAFDGQSHGVATAEAESGDAALQIAAL
jgi:hypothetical protein